MCVRVCVRSSSMIGSWTTPSSSRPVSSWNTRWCRSVLCVQANDTRCCSWSGSSWRCWVGLNCALRRRRLCRATTRATTATRSYLQPPTSTSCFVLEPRPSLDVYSWPPTELHVFTTRPLHVHPMSSHRTRTACSWDIGETETESETSEAMDAACCRFTQSMASYIYRRIDTLTLLLVTLTLAPPLSVALMDLSEGGEVYPSPSPPET